MKTIESFIPKYAPIIHGDSMLRDDLPPDALAKNVWTLVQAGNRDILCAGFHRVNRLGYVLCGNPWTVKDCNDEYQY